MKFSIKDFFKECEQIRSFLRIWSHLLKKSFTENFIFLQCMMEFWNCNTSVVLYSYYSSMVLLTIFAK